MEANTLEHIEDSNTGSHDGGVGWNPQGVYCGECCRATCSGCVNQHVEKNKI